MDPILVEYDAGITCVDAMYVQPGHACCYLMVENGRAAFIDTGTGHSVPYLLETIKLKNLNVEDVDYVIPTHVHLDHAGGAGLLMSKLPNAKLVIHPRGAPHMIDPEKLVAGTMAVYGEEKFKQYYGEIIPIEEQRVTVVEDEHEIQLANRTLKFLDAPGHARHHFCVYDKTSNGFFTGDTFGLSYKELDNEDGAFILPTTTPVQFEPDAWQNTLTRMLDYQPKNMYLTHFGCVTEIDRLTAQLREGIDEYANIAKSCMNSENREQKIKEKITENLKTKLRERYPENEVVTFIELFKSDIDLNAAGLEVWVKRLDKVA
ncbi:MAG: MBL fold metallo-hydrolase [Gammaproteobacteria bacterium]|nr:MBL fold metallo-hydrolase [Gammaproteobacteria bacterium]